MRSRVTEIELVWAISLTRPVPTPSTRGRQLDDRLQVVDAVGALHLLTILFREQSTSSINSVSPASVYDYQQEFQSAEEFSSPPSQQIDDSMPTADEKLAEDHPDTHSRAAVVGDP